MPGGQQRLPSPALSMPAGGTIAVKLDDPSGTATVEPFFEIRLTIDEIQDEDQNPIPLKMMMDQRIVARFNLPKKPLAVQWWRALTQLIQRRFQVQL